ncbi:MAG: hypothetical protein AAFY16_10910 [Cyanobacteria bacterium J06642_3]
MKEFNSISAKINHDFLKDPEQGRVYLKAALAQNDEQVFLSALHNVIDSLIDSEFLPSSGVTQFAIK